MRSVRRPLRTAALRTALAVAAATGLLAGAAVASPAQAATPDPTAPALAPTPAPVPGLGAATEGGSVKPPTVHLVTGNGTITANWSAVAHATGYSARLFDAHGRIATIGTRTGRTAVFGSAHNGTAYTVQVVALRAAAPTSLTSRAVHGTPTAGVPTPITITSATGDGANRISVDWRGGANATKVAVLAGSDTITDTNHFATHWLFATAQHVIITVPAALRDKLGVQSGQPVFIKVVATNSRAADPEQELFFDPKTDYRLSPPGTWSMAGVTDPTRKGLSRLTIGELNVQSVGSSANFTATDQWAARLPRLVKTIQAAQPDLLATAELSTQLVHPCPSGNHPSKGVWCNRFAQYMDLAHALATGPVHYAIATEDAYSAVHKEMAMDGQKWNGAVTDGAHLFYNPAKLTLLRHGYISPVFTLHIAGWTPKLGDRWTSWAEFRTKGKNPHTFYAAATHFPVGKSASIIALRATEASRTAAYLDTLAKGLPIVFAGDLNADAVRDTNPGVTKFIDDGYFDAAATTHRTNIRYSTSNGTNGYDGPDAGYPRHAVPHAYPTSRIDYILLKGSPYTYRYQNVMHLHGTAFIHAYQGTDHNLQLADVGID